MNQEPNSNAGDSTSHPIGYADPFGKADEPHYRRVAAGLIGIILLLATWFRLTSIHFGLPALNDPDELIFELGAIRMLRDVTLNPGWFGHPATTTMYVLALTNVAVFLSGYLVGWFPSAQAFADAVYANPTWMILPGRLAMTAFALGSIYLTYRLGCELFERRVGLAAAALLALDPLHITYSQIVRSDIMASFFMLLCLLAALRVARHGKWRDYVMTSLWLGVTIATKWPFALAAPGIAGAIFLRIAANPARRRRELLRLALCGAMSIGFLLLTSPYLIIESATLLRNLRGEVQLHHLGATGGSPLYNAWWYLSGPLQDGLGVAGLLLTAWGGFVLARPNSSIHPDRRREALCIIVPVAIAFFVLLCLQRLVFARWSIPLLPLFSIFAGLALAWLELRARRHWTGLPVICFMILVFGATLLPLASHALHDGHARMNDTRQRASRWAQQNVPPGSSVILEHFAFDLVNAPWRLLFPLGDAGCVDAKAMLQGKINYSLVEENRGSRSNIDYGTIARNRESSCNSDFAIFTEYDRYRAEQGYFPNEYETYRRLLAHGKIVATFAPSPGVSGGPVVRVVRMRNLGATNSICSGSSCLK